MNTIQIAYANGPLKKNSVTGNILHRRRISLLFVSLNVNIYIYIYIYIYIHVYNFYICVYTHTNSYKIINYLIISYHNHSPYPSQLCTALFDNIITFRKQDASIPFPTLGGATSMDLRFQFLTTAENGIFVQNTGRTHFIEIKIVLGNSIHFRLATMTHLLNHKR